MSEPFSKSIDLLNDISKREKDYTNRFFYYCPICDITVEYYTYDGSLTRCIHCGHHICSGETHIK